MEITKEGVAHVKGFLKPCCIDKANLLPPEPTGVEGEVFRRCKVCGCRHFKMQVDTGELGIIGYG